MKLRMEHHFDSAHQLNGYKGACANLHGHRWIVDLEIELKGNEITEKIPNVPSYELNSLGMMVDFNTLKKEIDKLDHASILNVKSKELIDYLLRVKAKLVVIPGNPTAENLALYLADKLIRVINKENKMCKLTNLKLYENPNSYIILNEEDLRYIYKVIEEGGK